MGPWPIIAADSRENGTPTGLSLVTPGETDDDGWDDGVIKLCIFALG